MNKPGNSEHRSPNHKYDSFAQRNAEHSPLLRLPAEIRKAVYEYAFDTATLQREPSPTSTGPYRVLPNSSRLLRVCRQIRFETRPFQTKPTYTYLTIRMEGKHVADMVEWIGAPQCARIVEIGMFQSLAGAILRQVRSATVEGEYTGPWAVGGDRAFPALERVVITYPTRVTEDAREIVMALQALFGNTDLEVEFREAGYWA